MNATNNKPVILSPVYQAKINGNFEPSEYVKQVLATPLFDPVVQGQPVSFTTSKGDPIDADEITDHVMACCGTVMNTTMETWCKSLFSQTLVYFDKNTHLGIQELFPVQAAVSSKLPFPDSTIVYTPASDVIPVSREFLAGQCNYDKYLATMAFYTRANTLAFYFANEAAFDAFKAWLLGQTNNLAQVLPSETNQSFADFQSTIKLPGLTESLLLRNQDDENNDEYSFARVLVSLMMDYTKQASPAEFGVLPFTLGELFCPRTVVFVNVEKHSRASAKQVADEWAIINQSLSMSINMVSRNKLSRLTGSVRNLRKIQGMAANAATNPYQSVRRSANMPLRKTPPTTSLFVKWVKKLTAKMANVAKSENSYKSVKMSFAKPNRRNPDDFNKQGKTVSTKYRPDIHIYLDTSGSISEQNYQGAIMALIRLAKVLNVNLYFNSFSHCMSQCHKLNLRDKTIKQIWNEFRRIPKVGGGTDYEQIWHYINRSKQRRRELSLIITDFEWTARSVYVKHPKNLYYAPCAGLDWRMVTSYADDFIKSCLHNEPNIRAHILA